MSEKVLDAHTNRLQELLGALGRDDIGVGDVSETDGRLLFTLTRGTHTERAEIPTSALVDRAKALATLNTVVIRLSKAIEQDHLRPNL